MITEKPNYKPQWIIKFLGSRLIDSSKFLVFLIVGYWTSRSWGAKAHDQTLDHFYRNFPHKYSMESIFLPLKALLTCSKVGFCIQSCYFWKKKIKKKLGMSTYMVCRMFLFTKLSFAAEYFLSCIYQWQWNSTINELTNRSGHLPRNKAEKNQNSQALRIQGLGAIVPFSPCGKTPKGRQTLLFYSGLTISGRQSWCPESHFSLGLAFLTPQWHPRNTLVMPFAPTHTSTNIWEKI